MAIVGSDLKSTLIYLSIYDVTDAEKRVEITFEMLLRWNDRPLLQEVQPGSNSPLLVTWKKLCM